MKALGQTDLTSSPIDTALHANMTDATAKINRHILILPAQIVSSIGHEYRGRSDFLSRIEGDWTLLYRADQLVVSSR